MHVCVYIYIYAWLQKNVVLLCTNRYCSRKRPWHHSFASFHFAPPVFWGCLLVLPPTASFFSLLLLYIPSARTPLLVYTSCGPYA